MNVKPYDLGLAVGRFQIFHKGHENNINTALQICDRVLVLVGSAQESGTERNPFDIHTRIKLIEEIYGNSVLVRPLSDLTNETDITPDWGKYLLDKVKYYTGKAPEVMIYGDEDAQGWFDKGDIDFLRLVMPRSRIPISATMLRELLANGDLDEWMKWHSPKCHKHFPELREQLLRCSYYKEIRKEKQNGS
jgi:bifunctional NMN adenylyltransferase/nudix hydrolase